MSATLMLASLAIAAGSAEAPSADADRSAIATMIESVATFADRGEFDALERLYAPEVKVDYTSLNGGEPQVKSAQALMTEWASVLPGFDRTRHSISEIVVQLQGSTANATAKVVADHWVGSLHWQVTGSYDYAFVRDGRDWRISSHRFNLHGESGTRDVFGPAQKAAQERPTAYLTRRKSRDVVLAFLTGLEDKDMERVNGVWAEDAVQEMPYVPNGFPSRVAGKEALIRQYAAWPQNAGKANFTNGIRFYPTLDPEIVAVEYRGVSEILTTRRTYDQRYFGVFHVENGKIQLFREYFDPNVFARAFGLGEGGSFYQK